MKDEDDMCCYNFKMHPNYIILILYFCKKFTIMKKLLMMVSFLCLSILGMAQDSTMTVKHGGKHHGNKENHGQKVAQVANPAAWACPKCYSITKAGGVCATDQTEMVQLGTYYCEHCMKASGSKPGKCASCSMATTQMTRKLCAKHNHAEKMPVKKAA